MNVGDLFERLSYGELSNLSIGMDGAGTIAAEDQPRILHYANMALTGLYSRFSDKRDYVNIRLSEAITKYILQTQYAVSDTTPGNNAPRYIEDTAEEPFPGNLIKIVSVHTDDDDTDDTDPVYTPLNETKSLISVKTTAFDTLKVSNPVTGHLLTIECVLGHPKLTVPVDTAQLIELHPLLEEALELKVAAKVYSSMNGQEHVAKSQLLNSQYEAVCLAVEEKDLLQLTTTADHDKLVSGGWNGRN